MTDWRPYDFRELLNFYTGQDWREIEDMDTDGGRDYFFFNDDDSEAHVRVEGQSMKVTIDDELFFNGKMNDDPVRAFINRRTPPEPNQGCENTTEPTAAH